MIKRQKLDTIDASMPAPDSGGMEGLGDLVHAVAQPIAKAIDATFGTRIQGCGGCSGRRAKWNKAVPFKTRRWDTFQPDDDS